MAIPRRARTRYAEAVERNKVDSLQDDGFRGVQDGEPCGSSRCSSRECSRTLWF